MDEIRRGKNAHSSRQNAPAEHARALKASSLGSRPLSTTARLMEIRHYISALFANVMTAITFSKNSHLKDPLYLMF
jgi:hypothetical protein